MAQRHETADSPDDFPTPPWATRALIEHVIGKVGLEAMTCLEPACGRGHMSRTLEEYFGSVASSDAYQYGYGQIRDFLGDPFEASSHDWVITNPPFRLAEEFVNRALAVARVGVAILARTVFLESLGQYQDRRPASEPSATAEESIPIPVRSPLPDDAHPDSNAKGTWPP